MVSLRINRQSTLAAHHQRDATTQSSQLKKASSLDYRLFTIWVVLNIIDAIVSYIVLRGGGIEINPVANLAIKHLQLGPALAIKVFLAAPVAILILRWKPRLLLSLNILMVCVVTFTATSVILSYAILH